MTELVTEMPRCFSISIQSEVACRELFRALTVPAIWMAPPNSRSFSVSVVLPAPGWETIERGRGRDTPRTGSGGKDDDFMENAGTRGAGFISRGKAPNPLPPCML